MNPEPKVALITGANGALGQAIAERLAQEGWALGLHYRTRGELATTLHNTLAAQSARCCLVQGDIRSANEVAHVVMEIERSLGPISLVVNNAGIVRDRTLGKLTEEDWDAVVDTSLKGAYLVTRASIEGMRERKWGRVVNISSIVGAMGNFGQTHYAAAKAGLIGFTKSLARETARANVTVNAICPGFMDTPMVRGVPAEVQKKLVEQIPLGRFGEPEAVGHAVAFLAGPGGAYITGQVLHVNGGMYM